MKKSVISKSIVYFANRPLLVGAVYVLSLMVGAALFSQFEGKTFGEGLWWSVVTALTVGYGDYSPVTLEMRIIACILQHFWIFFILPIVIATVLGAIMEDWSKFTHEEQEWTQGAIEKIAAALKVKLPEQPADF